MYNIMTTYDVKPSTHYVILNTIIIYAHKIIAHEHKSLAYMITLLLLNRFMLMLTILCSQNYRT